MGGSDKPRRAEVLQRAERGRQRVVLAPETTALLDPHPEIQPFHSRSRVRQTVRHEHPAEAHASPPHTGTAYPLTCGEADNPGEADGTHHPKTGPFQGAG